MYGTVAKLRAKAGMADELLKNLDREDAGDGYVTHYIYQMDKDPNKFILVVVYKSKESYHKSAQSPESHAEFEKMMHYLEAEPEWFDGEIVHSGMA